MRHLISWQRALPTCVALLAIACSDQKTDSGGSGVGGTDTGSGGAAAKAGSGGATLASTQPRGGQSSMSSAVASNVGGDIAASGGAVSATTSAAGGTSGIVTGGASSTNTANARGGVAGNVQNSNTKPSAGGSKPTGGAGSGTKPNAGASGTATGSSSSSGGTKPVGGTTGTTTPSAGGASGANGADAIATIHNAVYWNDTSGKRIEAHGGGFLLVDGTWYWIGEDKSKNSGNFNAVNCYASKDLQNWEFRRAIITRSTASELSTSDRIIERPKVIYNESTKKFVMWVHWEGKDYAEAAAGVFSSSTVDGAYTFHQSFRPNNNMSRDSTLFKDTDGKAYFLSAANNNADLVLYELTDDYLDVKRQVTTLWAGSSREAPALWKQGDRYFMINSGCTGWDPNQAKYSTATSIGGPWSSLTNIGDSTTYDTQSTFVIPIQGTKTTTYVFAGDRWQDPDLVSSKYIWLPLKLSGTSVSMDYYDTWQLNLTTGEWSANDGYLSQSGWKLLQADSQETSGENGKATNAFDDSPSTIWHTQYSGTTTPYPHEIQIDLGAAYSLTAMRYLPRQDKDDHGIVAKYQFYVSQDPAAWGTAVASGTFDSDRSGKVVTFTKTTGRYVRFVALSEINGGDWASMAELDLIGTPQ